MNLKVKKSDQEYTYVQYLYNSIKRTKSELNEVGADTNYLNKKLAHLENKLSSVSNLEHYLSMLVSGGDHD